MGLHFGKATSIFLKTLPFILVRLAVGAVFGLLAVIYFGVVLWVLFSLLDSISGLVALVALGAAFLVFAGIVKLLRKYVLYLVSAAHIAVVAHIVDTGEVPSNQLSFGKEKVSDRFVEASALFVVDKVVKSVIKQFNKAIMSLSSLVGFVPALRNIVRILQQAVALSASYIDEAILAHMFLHDEKGNWTAARDGVVLYGKTWKPVLVSTIIIVVAGQLLGLLALVAMAPLAGVFGSLAPTVELIGWAVVLGLGAVLYFGLIGPWIKTVVVTTYLIESREETTDSETMDWIAEKSSRFGELVSNAEEEASDGDAQPPTDQERPDPGAGPGAPN